MNLEKLSQAKEKLKEIVSKFTSPALMCSFGEDSMVLLHLSKSLGQRLPIIFHRHPWMPEKNKFADEMIVKFGLMVYDWPPSYTGIKWNKDMIELNNVYHVGKSKYMALPIDVVPMEDGKPWVCGRFDIMDRPIGTCNHPWDALLVAHRDDDVDPYYGPIPLKTNEYLASESLTITFPLRNWTESDIWDYTEEFGVPVHTDRYQNRKELENKDLNPDYVRACTRCIDPREGETVHCPMLNKRIKNISSKYPNLDKRLDYIDYACPSRIS